MKAGRWIMTCVFAVCVTLPFTPSSAKAAASVKVELPTYAVNVDGKKIDNVNLTYPLITYNGITYFPLTWNVATGLGLAVSWSPDAGLSVQSHKPKQNELAMETGPANTRTSYMAQVAPFPVTIDGQTVNKESETWPLLTFRDVTYFPMTWDYAVKRFGWKTSWDGSEFSIFTGPVWERLFYDDESYLYAYAHYDGANRIVKIRKDFQGPPELLKDEEAERIRELAYPPAETVSPKHTERKGNKLYGEGAELIDVHVHAEKHAALYEPGTDNVEYSERIVKTEAGGTVFNLALHPPLASLRLADPDTHTYFVKNSKAIEIHAFDRTIQGTESAAGGTWLWSRAPGVRSTSTNPLGSAGSVGKVLWLDSEGNARLWNDTLKAEHLRVLQADENALIVEAYRLTKPPAEPSDATQGYFRIQADGSYEKLADTVQGQGYADRQGQLYELSGPNRITNLTKNISHTWKDSELAESRS